MIESDERQQQDTLRTSELVARTEAKLLILEQRDRDNAWSMLARSAEQPKGSSPYHRKARSISVRCSFCGRVEPSTSVNRNIAVPVLNQALGQSSPRSNRPWPRRRQPVPYRRSESRIGP